MEPKLTTAVRSRIVDYLSDVIPPNEGSYVTYLYCDYQRTKSAIALVGAQVRQLLTRFKMLPDPVDKLVHHAYVKMRRHSASMDEIC